MFGGTEINYESFELHKTNTMDQTCFLGSSQSLIVKKFLDHIGVLLCVQQTDVMCNVP